MDDVVDEFVNLVFCEVLVFCLLFNVEELVSWLFGLCGLRVVLWVLCCGDKWVLVEMVY